MPKISAKFQLGQIERGLESTICEQACYISETVQDSDKVIL